MKRTLFILLAVLGMGISVNAQNFTTQQKKQEATIKVAYKRKKITEKEYEKLMEEQGKIKVAIAKAEADEVWTSREKNSVNGKLEKAEIRLKKYENNSEVY